MLLTTGVNSLRTTGVGTRRSKQVFVTGGLTIPSFTFNVFVYEIKVSALILNVQVPQGGSHPFRQVLEGVYDPRRTEAIVLPHHRQTVQARSVSRTHPGSSG